jgi:transcription initiation factor TFIIIB Brf1 subunit/transcription initiation factor TFIIB
MVFFKGCRRCGGDLFLEHDYRDDYITCLQCGYVLTDAEEEELSRRIPQWISSRAPSNPTAA